jgi:hypothetical protein
MFTKKTVLVQATVFTAFLMVGMSLGYLAGNGAARMGSPTGHTSSWRDMAHGLGFLCVAFIVFGLLKSAVAMVLDRRLGSEWRDSALARRFLRYLEWIAVIVIAAWTYLLFVQPNSGLQR